MKLIKALTDCLAFAGGKIYNAGIVRQVKLFGKLLN